MKSRWTKDEEIKFIKSLSKGRSFEELSLDHDRSVSALELRLKKIIYDNIIKGIEASKLSKKLNIDEDKIMQYYYSYKEFREKNGKTVENIDLTKKDISPKPLNPSKKVESLGELIRENELLEAIIKNNELKHKINRMYEKDKLTKKTKKIVDKIIMK